MNTQLHPSPTRDPAIYTPTPGEIIFYFPWAMVQIAFASRGTACLPAGEEYRPGTAGVLSEVSVFQSTQNSRGESFGVESFPYSPRGFALAFATNEQVAAILHWASLLQAPPPLPQHANPGPK